VPSREVERIYRSPRRLPGRFHNIPIFVTLACGLRYLGFSRTFDPILYTLAERLVNPGAVVWDVGANFGLFTFCSVALSEERSYTVAEPDNWLCGLMKRSFTENSSRLGQLEIENAAVGATCGIGHLEVSRRSRAYNKVGLQGLPTRMVTLDSLRERHPHPTVLKIDVET
jgi:FkbM family methyltransferase